MIVVSLLLNLILFILLLILGGISYRLGGDNMRLKSSLLSTLDEPSQGEREAWLDGRARVKSEKEKP